jgi:hypothetical protein
MPLSLAATALSPELNTIEVLREAVKNGVPDRNVTFKTEDANKLSHENFVSVSKDGWKLTMQSSYCISRCVATEALLDES